MFFVDYHVLLIEYHIGIDGIDERTRGGGGEWEGGKKKKVHSLSAFMLIVTLVLDKSTTIQQECGVGKTSVFVCF